MATNPNPYLEAHLDQGVLVLTVLRKQLEGEDVAAALNDELLAAIDRHGARLIVLDMKNARYVSSIAFWPLLRLRQRLAEMEGRLIICGLTGPVHDVFATTKMISSGGSQTAPFEMANDRETAMARMLASERRSGEPKT